MWASVLRVAAVSSVFPTFCGASLPSLDVFLHPLNEQSGEPLTKPSLCVCIAVQKSTTVDFSPDSCNQGPTSSAAPSIMTGQARNSEVDVRLPKYRDCYSESENIRLQAALDTIGGQALTDEFISHELGDIVNSRSVNAVRQKLARMYYKPRTDSVPTRYTEADEDLMRAQTLIYKQTDPKKAWTQVAIEKHFPELVLKHGVGPLRSKLSRLGKINIADEKTKCVHDRRRHRVYKYYTQGETDVLIRAVLENRSPSDSEKRALFDRDPDAIRHKMADIRKKLLRAQPERMLPYPFNPTGDS